MSDTSDRIIAIVTDLFADDIAGLVVTASCCLHDLNLDSLDVVELEMALETEFNLPQELDLIGDMTIADAADRIDGLRQEAGAC